MQWVEYDCLEPDLRELLNDYERSGNLNLRVHSLSGLKVLVVSAECIEEILRVA